MGVFDKKKEIARLKKRVSELEEENKELSEVIKQLKENHAVHVSQLKDKIKRSREAYEKELDDVRFEYSKWIETHKGYNETLRQINESLMIKDIELNDIMNKIILKK